MSPAFFGDGHRDAIRELDDQGFHPEHRDPGKLRGIRATRGLLLTAIVIVAVPAFGDAGDVLKKALFDPETEVVLFFVSDFSIRPEAIVKLKYTVVLDSEGNFIVREDRAMLKSEAGAWKILSMGAIR